MLTDEHALELWSGPGNRPVMGKNKVIAFARAIEQEVLQAQEPVLVVGFKDKEWRAFLDVLTDLPDGTKLYTTQQPPAPCPECERSRNATRSVSQKRMSFPLRRRLMPCKPR